MKRKTTTNMYLNTNRYPRTNRYLRTNIQAGSKYTLLCSDKYSPGKGLLELGPVSLGLVGSLLSYVSNGCISEKLSVTLIVVLFWRDFKTGEH